MNLDVETLKKRITICVPENVARSFRNRERLLTIPYRKEVSLLGTYIPFRIALKVFNNFTKRTARKEDLPLKTFVSDFYQEGTAIYEAKRNMALEILKQYHFNPDTLEYLGDEWPEEWKQPDDILVTITGNEPLPELISGFVPAAGEMIEPDLADFDDEEGSSRQEKQEQWEKKAEQLYSQPDTKAIILRRKRRSTRVELEPEDIEWACNGYVTWLNKEVEENSCKILRAWELEKGSMYVVYISIDAVYVEKQCSTHVKGIKPEMKDKKKRISHWNVAVEFDGLRYCITDKTLFGSFQQLFAFLLVNKLMSWYFVFIADGETEIFDLVNKYFERWQKSLYLDWYHLQEKVHQRTSSAIIHKMVVDPRKKAKAESEGTPSGEIKRTALSNLYGRKLNSILWVGNVDAAIDYVKHIDPQVIKNQNAIDMFIDYLERKREWIPCYALRNRAGLRNASNGSEGSNDILVADRQKVDGMTWCEEGSYSASNQSVIYANGEDDLWFDTNQVTFIVPEEKRAAGLKSVKKQVRGKKNV